MIDKGHCMMNMEDEEEYLDFYDFSKTYENHPLLIGNKGVEEIKADKPKKVVEEEDEGSWEDCDGVSLDSAEDVDDEDGGKIEGDGSDSDDFEILDGPTTTKSFSIIDGEKETSSATDGF